jgi:hypothetical protein
MNKTFWIGLVALFVVSQALGYVVHQVWLADTYQALASAFRPEAEMMDMMWIMMLTGLGVLFLFCYIFTRGYEGKGIGEGVRYGAMMGVLLGFPAAIDVYVIYPITAELSAMWFVSGVVSFIIFGAIFAAIYKPSSS